MKKKYVPDLVQLGALYEGNYRRLTKLIGMMDSEPRMEFSLHTGSLFVGKVAISQLESCKYTDTFLLEQVAAAGKWINNPKMTVRLYHDASVAEVISSFRHKPLASVHSYPNDLMLHPDEKSQLNSFLSEWLSFCLSHGCCDKIPFTRAKL